ncbi:hypothetical protein EVA_20756 [gut metagenome]|uniref:Uncharacterized protein n=1 Tax=gut metagenome TaxID=749906 RepID=J9FNI1_9ZZZZ
MLGFRQLFSLFQLIHQLLQNRQLLLQLRNSVIISGRFLKISFNGSVLLRKQICISLFFSQLVL